MKVNVAVKNFTLFLRPHVLLGWCKSPLLTIAYTLHLSKWIKKQNKTLKFNDFCTFKRDHDKRKLLYEHVIKSQNLENETIDYLEFGVDTGASFIWWLQRLTNNENRFYGFDTFEGLPEDWGAFFVKGDMSSDIPTVNDDRAIFFKGLFQDTLLDFLKSDNLKSDRRKVIHMDADLFSATLFVLTTLYPYLKSGDIIFFDEFNVPQHEFLAFKIFTESYYIKYEMLGAINNYYHAVFMVK